MFVSLEMIQPALYSGLYAGEKVFLSQLLLLLTYGYILERCGISPDTADIACHLMIHTTG